MKESFGSIIDIRRMVFSEVAHLAYTDADLSLLSNSVYKLLPGEKATFRESIFLERAVIGERLRLALGLDVRSAADSRPIAEGIDEIRVSHQVYRPPLVNVISFACMACGTKAVTITDNCRKCLAHPCTHVCPTDAVKMGRYQAEIDQEKCITCGRCLEACPFGAIIRYDRPCAKSCGVGAIGSDHLGRAQIDHDKCVACGVCIQECPFGAIADKSELYQLIKAIKSDEEVYGIVAPSFVGQFGPLTTPAQIFAGIRQLGFADVLEVGIGADQTTMHEALEYLQEVPAVRPYMGTSCCSAWAMMVAKLFPEAVDYISDSATPMIYTAQEVKRHNPAAKIAFIGPCIAKKLEALDEKVAGYVDFVITFEELMGMFVAKGVELSEIAEAPPIDQSSVTARGYALAGGVAEAVRQRAAEIAPAQEIKVEAADTLGDCVTMMRLAKAGKKPGYLLEGMACRGGCIGGPGTLALSSRASKAVRAFMAEAPYKSPEDNAYLQDHK